MLRYALSRILFMVPTLLGVAVLVFFMLRIVPGDVVEVKLRGDGGNVTQEVIDQERKRLGLDRPLLQQFGDWMVGLAKLDLVTREEFDVQRAVLARTRGQLDELRALVDRLEAQLAARDAGASGTETPPRD